MCTKALELLLSSLLATILHNIWIWIFWKSTTETYRCILHSQNKLSVRIGFTCKFCGSYGLYLAAWVTAEPTHLCPTNFIPFFLLANSSCSCVYAPEEALFPKDSEHCVTLGWFSGDCQVTLGWLSGDSRLTLGDLQVTCRWFAGDLKVTCRRLAGDLQVTCR